MSFLEVGFYLWPSVNSGHCVSVQAGKETLCINMQLRSERVHMLRSKGNPRFVAVACVPSLMLTHLVQSADQLPAGAEDFITLPLQILDLME